MAGPARPTVYVADDHPVYRDGVVAAVKARPDLQLVGQESDGRLALDELRDLQPEVALLDMKLPGLDGLQMLDAIVQEGLPTRVLFVSAFLEQDIVYRAIARGAAGYLSKDADRDQICDAAAAVARGETRFAAEVQAGLAHAIRIREAGDRPLLTQREREVLGLTAEGLSAAQVGERLHLSPATVKSHLQGAYQKLGVSDRAAAVATALRQGLLD
jgi:two-component system, NarL family, nitrate/nitrite response regulator NarL